MSAIVTHYGPATPEIMAEIEGEISRRQESIRSRVVGSGSYGLQPPGSGWRAQRTGDLVMTVWLHDVGARACAHRTEAEARACVRSAVESEWGLE